MLKRLGSPLLAVFVAAVLPACSLLPGTGPKGDAVENNATAGVRSSAALSYALVDVSAEDLYDPRVIIRLGAKYVSTLSKQLADDHYKTAAAYNAGPNQVVLWSRLAPGEGEDFFLSSINFDETKQYVRKVMNSYRRYAEIYQNAGPQGGVRIEP